MEETISLQDLFKTLKKRLVLILLAILLAVTVAGVFSFLWLTPIYQASTQILVNQQKFEQSQFNSQDIQANLQLINTYNVIIKSPAILSKVIKNLDLDTTPAALNSKITVNSAQNSQVVNISVQDPEPYVAVDIANTTAEVFQEEIQKLMNVDNVNILSPAVLVENPSPVKPDPYLNMIIAGVIGLMLGVGIAFLLEYLDTTVKTEQDIEKVLGLPILGLISPISEKDIPSKKRIIEIRKKGEVTIMFKKTKKPVQTAARKLVASVNPKSIVSEQFRTVRTNITFSMPDKDLNTLLITSSAPGEGKSTCAANIAIVFAQEGKRVLLVDADLRKPTMHYTFQTTNTTGLSNLLVRKCKVDEAIKKTEVKNLHLVTCGPIPPNPAELLGSKTMDALIKEFIGKYDLVLFDAPPLLSVADSQILANKCDGTILVVNSGLTQKNSAIKAKEALASAKANVIGTLLNNFVLEKNHYYYQYYGTGE